ncbi:MAG: CatA-like O-acetyltransferase [Prolixibacteraceae bacterium]
MFNRKEIDLSSWKRREHFEFFSQMQEPFHSVTVEMDVTKAYQRSVEENQSYFLTYMHAFGRAMQDIENLRYRLVDGKVYCYDFIELGSTIGREDETFGFGILGYDPDFNTFVKNATKVIEKVQATEGLCVEANDAMPNIVYCSTLPWTRFTAVSHARHFDERDSIPRISFGMRVFENEKYVMPFSILVDHSLVDGIHVAKFLDKFQLYLDSDYPSVSK